MRSRVLLAAALWLAASALPLAQRVALPDLTQLPVRRVVLYKSGVGFFEHLGTVTGSRNIAIQFTSAQLNDALSSLTALDLDRGAIAAISYNSVAPLQQQLKALRLPLSQNPDTTEFYDALRGTRVEVRSRTGAVTGRVLGIERRPRGRGDATEEIDLLTIVSDDGATRTIVIDPGISVRVADADVRADLSRYLGVIAADRGQDVRRMTIAANGTGTRRVLVSYVSEVPVWKSTYRLVLPERTSDRPLLQAWAIVDNTVGEDWANVELSLVAGAPQSFIQNVSQPLYTRRPVVELTQTPPRGPQTHEATLQAGTGVTGVVRDASGAILPGVTVRLRDSAGVEISSTTTNASGRFDIAAPPGDYQLRTELPGFTTIERRFSIATSGLARLDTSMSPGALQETVTVSGLTPRVSARRSAGSNGAAPMVEPPPAPALQDALAQRAQTLAAQTAAASGQELGDLFEYRIKEPVTIRKNQSALVPTLNAPVEAERLSIWSTAPGSGRPLRAVWLTNTTGATLDGGAITVLDANAFAGEGLIQPLKPGEKRLVSYGTDLGVLVDARIDASSGRFSRLTARDGVMVAQQEDHTRWVYRIRNEDTTPRTVLVEHAIRPGWTISAAPAPAESTPNATRYRMAVAAKGEATLTIDEVRPGETRFAITQVDDRLIATFTQRGVAVDALRRVLQPVFDKRAELAAAETHTSAVDAQIDELGADQERIRNNMQALKGSAAEKALIKRYTGELNAQEDRLAGLRKELAAAQQQQDARRDELARLVQQLTFTLDMPAR